MKFAYKPRMVKIAVALGVSSVAILSGCGVSVNEASWMTGRTVSPPTSSPSSTSSIGTDSHATSGQGPTQVASSASFEIRSMRAFGAVQPTRASSAHFVVTVGVNHAQ